MLIFLFHFSLSILLFLIVNWIGKHSFSVGYVQMSIFQRDEEAPAFNYVYRILSPTVYIIIVATILYKFSLDEFTTNIFLIAIYYVAFRLSFNLITNRGLLINWTRQIITDLAIIVLAYLSYSKIIITKQHLMPDFSMFSEELWIIIVIFIYQVLNKVELSTQATKNRKNNYIKSRLAKFKKKYHLIITERIKNEKLVALIYSIMIYEDFNRPKVIRTLEYIVHKTESKSRTLGIMQVTTHKSINDYESLILAIDKINDHYYKIPEIIKENRKNRDSYYSYSREDNMEDWLIQREILKNYNADDDYIYEVSELMEYLTSLLDCSESSYTFELDTESDIKSHKISEQE